MNDLTDEQLVNKIIFSRDDNMTRNLFLMQMRQIKELQEDLVLAQEKQGAYIASRRDYFVIESLKQFKGWQDGDSKELAGHAIDLADELIKQMEQSK